MSQSKAPMRTPLEVRTRTTHFMRRSQLSRIFLSSSGVGARSEPYLLVGGRILPMRTQLSVSESFIDRKSLSATPKMRIVCPETCSFRAWM